MPTRVTAADLHRVHRRLGERSPSRKLRGPMHCIQLRLPGRTRVCRRMPGGRLLPASRAKGRGLPPRCPMDARDGCERRTTRERLEHGPGGVVREEPALRIVWHDLAEAHMLDGVMQLADLCVGEVPAWHCHHISRSHARGQVGIVLLWNCTPLEGVIFLPVATRSVG
jgi:hypothetical protein